MKDLVCNSIEAIKLKTRLLLEGLSEYKGNIVIRKHTHKFIDNLKITYGKFVPKVLDIVRKVPHRYHDTDVT